VRPIPALPRPGRSLPGGLSKAAAGIVLSAVLPFLFAGCSSMRLPSAYVPPLQQGNVIEQESLAKLKPGMTRSQVRFVLGTPLVIDVFRTDRWDYVYLLKRQGQPVQTRRVTVIFDGDLLARIEGDVVPGAASGAAPKAEPAPAAAKPPA
jgi:outer membrane protein assembly factor BamE